MDEETASNKYTSPWACKMPKKVQIQVVQAGLHFDEKIGMFRRYSFSERLAEVTKQDEKIFLEKEKIQEKKEKERNIKERKEEQQFDERWRMMRVSTHYNPKAHKRRMMELRKAHKRRLANRGKVDWEEKWKQYKAKEKAKIVQGRNLMRKYTLRKPIYK